MKELEILERLIESRRELPIKKMELSSVTDKAKSFIQQQEISILEMSIADDIRQLRLIINSQDSSHAHSKMIERLFEYENAIRKVTASHLISRNQGLVFQNRLFGIIQSDLRQFAEGIKIVPSSSSNLYYTSERTDGILKDKFADFLNSEAQSLRKLNPINFPDLEEFAMTFMSRAISQFPLN